eukprot:TRINITY_DN10131_c0_g1_i2.p1 TRINITY_DN10131_c0_g1~~TRINITY_DN10131_c0_g1_i2.p1  ORF type:complete len:240 (+),score=65.00 TRINITY_DN10131_c0_g1_i2:80-799(+)
MIRRPPRSTLSSSSAASDVYKRQVLYCGTATALIRAQDTRTQLKIYAHLQAATVGAPEESTKPPRLEVTERIKWKAWHTLCKEHCWAKGTACDEARAACLQVIAELDPSWRASMSAPQSRVPPKISARSPDDAVAKATWAPDHASASCMVCEAEFGWSVSRHHCRKCGSLVCGACSTARVSLPADGYVQPTRVCDGCVHRETALQQGRVGSPRSSQTRISAQEEALRRDIESIRMSTGN